MKHKQNHILHATDEGILLSIHIQKCLEKVKLLQDGGGVEDLGLGVGQTWDLIPQPQFLPM